MVSRSYGMVKSFLAETAGDNGLAVTDSRVLKYTNNAQRELANEGDWPGVVDRWYFRFDEVTGLVSLPYFLERLMSVTVDGAPKEIRSPWFEFVQYGPGQMHDLEYDSYGNSLAQRVDWTDVVADRGDSPTKVEIPLDNGPWSLRVTGTVDESDISDAFVTIQGLDSLGNVVRTLTNGTGWANGEALAIEESVDHDGVADWGNITSIIKPLTNGPVTLTAFNTGGDTLTLDTFGFDETSPTRRRYFIPSLWRSDAGTRDRIILARCRRRFQPVLADNDRLMIGNELALAEMMIAQYKRRQDDFEGFGAHKAIAVDIMKKEALAYTGRSRVPSLTFAKGANLGDIPALR